MNKDILGRSSKEKNAGVRLVTSDHMKSPSFRPSPRIVTPLSFFKRRPTLSKIKEVDVSDTEGEQRSGVSSVQADDDSTRSSVRSFRLGIMRSN